MHTTPQERAAWAAQLDAVSTLNHTALPIDADDLRRLLDDADLGARLLQDAFACLCNGDPLVCECQLEPALEPKGEESCWLTDRQFGRLLARHLARGADRTRVRRNGRRYDDLDAVAPNRIMPPPGCRDLGAFHDNVRLAVLTNEEQRTRMNQVAERRGLPPFFP